MRNITLPKVENAGATGPGRLSAAEDTARLYELLNFITTSGMSLDPEGGPDANLFMQAQATARYVSLGIFGVQGGTPNTITLSAFGLEKKPNALFHSMKAHWPVTTANTGPATVNAFALGSKKLLDENGAELTGGELFQFVSAWFDTTLDGVNGAWRLYPWANAFNRVRRISAPTLTLWVRTDGNDTTGDGSANSAAKAFLTVNGAIAYAKSNFALSGKALQIRLGNTGTYAAFEIGGQFADVQVLGDTGNQDAYIISGASGTSSAANSIIGARATLSGLKIVNTDPARAAVGAFYGSTLFLDRVSAGHNAGGLAVIASQSQSIVTAQANVKITSGGTAALEAQLAGQIELQSGGSILQTGTYAYSAAYANALNLGFINKAASFSITGSATGTRYQANQNSVINSAAGGANIFPGNVAGTTATGGQYI